MNRNRIYVSHHRPNVTFSETFLAYGRLLLPTESGFSRRSLLTHCQGPGVWGCGLSGTLLGSLAFTGALGDHANERENFISGR